MLIIEDNTIFIIKKNMWKFIKGLKNCYQVSTNGEVRSVDRTIKTKRGLWKYKGKIISQNIGTNGYYYVNLSVEGKHKTYYIHRLVAETFLDNTDNLSDVDHINENKLDNRLENLRYLTHFDNSSRSNKGKCRRDMSLEKNPKAKKVIGFKDGKIVEKYDCAIKVSNKYNINYSTLKRQLQNNNCIINGIEFYYEINT